VRLLSTGSIFSKTSWTCFYWKKRTYKEKFLNVMDCTFFVRGLRIIARLFKRFLLRTSSRFRLKIRAAPGWSCTRALFNWTRRLFFVTIGRGWFALEIFLEIYTINSNGLRNIHGCWTKMMIINHWFLYNLNVGIRFLY
jgi:hypothetical protein